MTTHGGCRNYITSECTFGTLQPIYLPPHAVSIPRTEVPMEAIIGVQTKNKGTPLQRDYSCRKYFTFFLSTRVLHIYIHIFKIYHNYIYIFEKKIYLYIFVIGNLLDVVDLILN